MATLTFSLELDIETDESLGKLEQKEIANNIVDALAYYARSSERGLIGDLEGYTKGAVIRNEGGSIIASGGW